MIKDARTTFCSATALNTGGAATYLIGSQIDLGVARNIGNEQQLYLVIQVDTAVDSSGDNTTQEFKLASDDSASISTTTSTVHCSTGAIAQAALTAGAQFILPVPPEGSTAYERYLGILQVTGVAAATAGKVNAFLTTDVSQWKALPDGLPAGA